MIIQESDYLMHHGILGQHWGIRRYQNKDGTLTEEGKKRYRISLQSRKYRSQEEHLDSVIGGDLQKNIKQIYNSGKIPKDFSMYRVSNTKNEPLDSHRKYVSLTYLSEYDKDNPVLIKDSRKAGYYEYKAAKELKLASKKQVQDYIFSTLPKDQKEYFENIRNASNYILDKNNLSLYTVGKTKFDKQVDNWIEDKSSELQKTYKNGMKWTNSVNAYKQNNNVFEHFKKAGYDAIVDIEDTNDYTNTIESGAVVILNPKDSIRLVDVD